MIPLDYYPIRLSSVVSDIFDDEALILAPDQGRVKVLNEVASRIWVLSDGTRTINEISDMISQEYEVDITVARDDTQQFIIKLIHNGVLQLSPTPLANTVDTGMTYLDGTN